jgi:transketolase N-terminal domain/subunit
MIHYQTVNKQDVVELAKKIRIDSLKMVHRAKASHIGSAFVLCRYFGSGVRKLYAP